MVGYDADRVVVDAREARLHADVSVRPGPAQTGLGRCLDADVCQEGDRFALLL